MHNILLKIGIFLVVMFVGAEMSLARVIVHEKEKFYSVRGKTGAQAYKSILRTGRRYSKSRHAIATTVIKFDFKNLKMVTKKNHCRLSRVDVILSLVYIYPKWRGYKRADRNSKKRWDSFFQQVKKHEKKHGSIAKNTARNVERIFKRAKGRVAKKCNDWERSMLRQIKQAVKKRDRQHAAFDKRDRSKRSSIRRSIVALKKSK